jgi:intraflagellar transport protein 172
VQIAATSASFKITARGGHDITKIDLYQDKFVVAFTTATLLLGNLLTYKLAEIDWQQSGGEKFYFENERTVMVYNLGELIVIQYDRNVPLISLRTEHVSPYLVSSAVPQYQSGSESKKVERVAYLVDLQTVRILDMATRTGPQVSTASAVLRVRPKRQFSPEGCMCVDVGCFLVRSLVVPPSFLKQFSPCRTTAIDLR